MKRVAYGGILVFGLYFAAVEGFVLSGMNQKESGELDYIIVLGARVTGETPGLALEKRISVAESYLKAHPDTLAVLSGGQGNDEQISEAECMRRALVAAGIEESRLILETRSTSTSENLLYSYALIPEGKKIGIVTNNFHVFRAKKIAEKLWGEHVSALSAPYPSVLLPHYLMREFFTVTLDFLRGNL